MKKIVMLSFLVIGVVTISCAQNNLITNERYKFTLTSPTGLSPLEDASAILEFRGTEKKYGVDSLFFLKKIIPFTVSPIEKMEAYLKEPSTVENMNKDFVNAMKTGFPDTLSIDKSFIYFNNRPAIQGSYSFSVREVPMTGRFMILLVKEQSSIYVFSWASKTKTFDSWNKTSEETVKSLKLNR